ncbi:hypothetical protein [Kushneria aurantia]|uniref:Uncharacterized protein n=1 Tax=Kushneria aurantia TaxID=504092 RepID=A0ABV6G4Z1_9GAMM|nr:hypothetical protein [Kushneria aurantia]
MSAGLDPFETLAAALERAPLVGLGEIHWCPAVLEAWCELIESPALAGSFDDIVVEFGASQHQALIDRYISGENVEDIDAVRRDTLYFLLWSAPVYVRFFERIRALNRRRAPHSPLRVVLAEPPVDWRHLDAEAFAAAHREREARYVECIEREVLGRGRRALLIFGLRHLARAGGSDGDSLAERLLARRPASITLIHPFHAQKGLFSVDQLPPAPAYHHMIATPPGSGVPADYLWQLGELPRRAALPNNLFDDPRWLDAATLRLAGLGKAHIERARGLMSEPQRRLFDHRLARS